MKRPVKNAAAFVSGDVGVRLIGFLVTVYLARVLSPEGFGLINIGLAILGHLGIVASPGISLLETRNAAASPGPLQERAGGVLMLRAIIAIALCTATWLIVLIFSSDGIGGHIVLIYVASLLPMAVSLDWFFQGKEQMGFVSASRLLAYFVYGLLVFLFVRTARDLPFAPAGFLAGNWAAAVLLLLAYGAKFGKLDLGWQPRLWWEIFKENLPVGTGMFLSQLVVNLPPIVLALIAGTVAVGQFSAAAKIGFLFLMFDRLLNGLFLPAISRYLAQKPMEAGRFFQVTLKGVIITVLPLAAAGVLLAPWLMRTVYGQAYEGSFPLLETLMGYVFLTVVNSVFVCTILGGDRTREYLRVTFLGGIFLAVAVTLLTFWLGERGTALGVVLGEAAVVVLSMREARMVVPYPFGRSFAAICLGAAGILALSIIAGSLSAGLAVLAAGALVFVTSLVVGGVDVNDIRYLRERIL